MPGVVCCIFAGDIPGSNATGAIEYDETVLADKQVHLCLSEQSGAGFTTRVDHALLVLAGDVRGSHHWRSAG